LSSVAVGGARKPVLPDVKGASAEVCSVAAVRRLDAVENIPVSVISINAGGELSLE